MPKGPKGEKRKADVIGNAVHIMRIATGEVEDATPDDGKDKAAQAMGRKGCKKMGQISIDILSIEAIDRQNVYHVPLSPDW